MIYLKLFLEFSKIGLFAFGGAYGSISLIQDVVVGNDWVDEAMLANLIALSESTPGPIMVNMATYIGSCQAGLPGAMLATLGVVLPSFVILLAIATLLRGWVAKRPVQAVLKGIKPCLMGVILSTGLHMTLRVLAGEPVAYRLDRTTALIFVILIAVTVMYRRWKRQELSPIALIMVAAVCGGALYG